jgi:hypothetical protein
VLTFVKIAGIIIQYGILWRKKMKKCCFLSVIFMFAFVFTNCVAQSTKNSGDVTYVVVPIELRTQVREYVSRKAIAGFEEMILSARNNEEIPDVIDEWNETATVLARAWSSE